MGIRSLAGSLLGAFALIALPAVTQERGVNLPDTTKCPDAVAELATCYTARLPTGAYLLAAMPRNWSGNLIVFAHGGPHIVPPTVSTSQTDLQEVPPSVSPWAMHHGVHLPQGRVRRADGGCRYRRRPQVLRRAHRQARRTVLHGASYGGLVGAKLIETSGNYDGAFFNSGAVAGSIGNYEFRADLRAVYQFYCNNLPAPGDAQAPLWAGLPAGSKMTLKEMTERIDSCTGIAKPADARSDEQKKNLANILGGCAFPKPAGSAHAGGDFVLRDLAERSRAGPQRVLECEGPLPGLADDALNRGVTRFDSDPAARSAGRS